MRPPGFARLEGPEILDGVTDAPDSYQRWHRHVVTQRYGEVWISEEAASAAVNHGRWVAACFWCGTGMLTRPDWGIAGCAECGAFYPKGKVRFPTNHAEIQEVLCRRPVRSTQSWLPTESIDDLRRENSAHGVA